ncbi:hypothetical protein EDD16DRAFT_1524552 [Pisolithus croceorrhizus]|nr:hypothetical protein EV401DRAFT_1896011 [Pisolithus croceorrhizus]KAI6104871.1 hypothetical protein EDD16DRAFT_1524552 [Pisolithus croceorrhizus]
MLLNAIETTCSEKSREVDGSEFITCQVTTGVEMEEQGGDGAFAGMKTVIVEISLQAGMSGEANPLAITDNKLILLPMELWALVGYEPSVPSISIELHSACAVHCNWMTLAAVAVGLLPSGWYMDAWSSTWASNGGGGISSDKVQELGAILDMATTGRGFTEAADKMSLAVVLIIQSKCNTVDTQVQAGQDHRLQHSGKSSSVKASPINCMKRSLTCACIVEKQQGRFGRNTISHHSVESNIEGSIEASDKWIVLDDRKEQARNLICRASDKTIHMPATLVIAMDSPLDQIEPHIRQLWKAHQMDTEILARICKCINMSVYGIGMYPDAGLCEMVGLLFHEHRMAILRSVLWEYFITYEPQLLRQCKVNHLQHHHFWVASINDIWGIDQHDKWLHFGLVLHTGIEPFSGQILWTKVWHSNHNLQLIPQYHERIQLKLHTCKCTNLTVSDAQPNLGWMLAGMIPTTCYNCFTSWDPELIYTCAEDYGALDFKYCADVPAILVMMEDYVTEDTEEVNLLLPSLQDLHETEGYMGGIANRLGLLVDFSSEDEDYEAMESWTLMLQTFGILLL